MPHPADGIPHSPDDFAEMLATPAPVLLVGGQAVNLWAIYYTGRTRELAPFVSRDVDVLGDRDTLAALGKVVGTKPQFFPLRPPSNEVGVVVAHDAAGLPLLIEVLRGVHGVTNAELLDGSYAMAVGERQVQVRVPGPIALLKAKIANVADLAQSGRQDGRHVMILLRLMPAFLQDLEQVARAGKMEERRFVEIVESLLKILTSAKAKRVLKTLRIDPRETFSELSSDDLPRVAAFVSKRLPRVLGSRPSDA